LTIPGIVWRPPPLLIHVISLNGEPSDIEKRKLHGLLETRFGLDPGTADQLIASATLVEGEAVDLYHFTSVIMRSVNEEGRLRIVEMMWELAYADGQVSEFEDNCRLARRRSAGHILARPDRSQASGCRQASRAGRGQFGCRRSRRVRWGEALEAIDCAVSDMTNFNVFDCRRRWPRKSKSLLPNSRHRPVQCAGLCSQMTCILPKACALVAALTCN